MSAARAKAPKIAAVICSYNRYPLLEKAIRSAAAQDMKPGDYEIIVVDNSPDHDQAAAFGAGFADIANLTYLVEKTPGLSNARNVGAAATRAGIVAYLDDDAVAEPGWLAGFVAAYAAHGPAAVAAGGRITPLWDVPRPDWLSDAKLGYLSVVDWGGSARIAGADEWLAGANISFRRKALQDIGGFNVSLGRNGPESSLLSNEESDVFKRLAAIGGQVLYVPEASVAHLVDRRRLEPDWFRRRSAWQAVSDYIENSEVSGRAETGFDNMLGYLLRQPPRDRAIAGLRRDQDDPAGFNDQMDAIYNLTLALLAGLKGLK